MRICWLVVVLSILGALVACSSAPHEDRAPRTIAGLPDSAAIGRLTSMGNDSARWFYSYDAQGREVTTETVLDNHRWRLDVKYGYPQNPSTTAGPGTNIVQETYPDGERVDFTHDAAGLAQTITTTPPGGSAQPVVTRMRRNARGDLTEVDFGNGVVMTWSFNDTGDLRLASVRTVHGSTTLGDLSYSWDANGNVSALADNLFPARSATFGYDSLDRLTSMVSNGVTYTYGYDAIDNLISKEGVAQQYGQGAGPHALTSVGSETYTYDPNGNLTLRGTKDSGLSIDWNAENMARTAQLGSVTVQRSFVHERLWKRDQSTTCSGTCKTRASKPERTYYPFEMVRIEKGAHRKFFAGWAERSPEDGRLRFYHGDLLGSSVLMTDDAGNEIHRAAYMPYGEDRADSVSGSFTPKYQFNFKEKDATGLYDYGARLYNPATGRWMSADDDTDAGLNRYAYTSNNPVTRIDPDGHQDQSACSSTLCSWGKWWGEATANFALTIADRANQDYWNPTVGWAVQKLTGSNKAINKPLAKHPNATSAKVGNVVYTAADVVITVYGGVGAVRGIVKNAPRVWRWGGQIYRSYQAYKDARAAAKTAQTGSELVRVYRGTRIPGTTPYAVRPGAMVVPNVSAAKTYSVQAPGFSGRVCGNLCVQAFETPKSNLSPIYHSEFATDHFTVRNPSLLRNVFTTVTREP